MSEADDLFDQLARRLRVISVHFSEAADELVALRKALADEAQKPPAPQPGPVPPQSWPGPQQPGPPLPQQPGPPPGSYPNAPQQWHQPPGQQWPGPGQQWPGPQQPPR